MKNVQSEPATHNCSRVMVADDVKSSIKEEISNSCFKLKHLDHIRSNYGRTNIKKPFIIDNCHEINFGYENYLKDY